MTPYQVFLVVMLFVWPLTILGVLMLMAKLEERIERNPARTPEEAGLEPKVGKPEEKEVRIVFDGRVIGEDERAERGAAHPAPPRAGGKPMPG